MGRGKGLVSMPLVPNRAMRSVVARSCKGKKPYATMADAEIDKPANQVIYQCGMGKSSHWHRTTKREM